MILYLFGADFNDRLILSWQTIYDEETTEKFFEYFHRKLTTDHYCWERGLFLNNIEEHAFDRTIYTKNENYNLEDSVKNAVQKYGRQQCNLYYILKNKIWYECSAKTDWLLKPCVGKFTDLTEVNLQGVTS